MKKTKIKYVEADQIILDKLISKMEGKGYQVTNVIPVHPDPEMSEPYVLAIVFTK